MNNSPCVFVFLGVENSKVVESQLADFLVFLRRVLSLRVMKRLSTFVKWIDPLMAIISHKCPLGKTLKNNNNIGVVYSAEQLTCVWFDSLFTITIRFSGSPCFQNLRTKLLAFHVLERLLPACSEPVQIQQV